jgi:hypothetical protein
MVSSARSRRRSRASASSFRPNGWPAIVNKPVDRLARSPRAWPVAAPPNYRPVAPPWCRSGRDRGLACSAEGTLHA